MKKIGEFVMMTILIFIAGVMNPFFFMFFYWMKGRAGFENAVKGGIVLLVPISVVVAFLISRTAHKSRAGRMG